MQSLGREVYVARQYKRIASNCIRQNPGSFGWADALRFYLPWRETMEADGHCLENELPWMTFPAISHLRDFVEPSMRVFEYGSGGSTVFFANRVHEVISVEHDREWYEKLQEELKMLDIDNWMVYHRPPTPIANGASGDPADPDDYVSSGDPYEGMSFRDYATQIDEYPDRHFDLIVVDGRARPSCFKHAVHKIKDTGMLVWDNTSRSRYHPAMKLAPEGFDYLRCPGPTPFLGHFTETSLWFNSGP
jgi:hypothetical protein